MGSDEGSNEKTSKERREEAMFEHQAEEELIMDNPEYLTFMWKDMKSKLKNKFKDGKMDDEVFEQMLSEFDAENKGTFQLPSLFSGIGSGIKSLVRFGRSVSNQQDTSPVKRRTKRAFWDVSVCSLSIILSRQFSEVLIVM
jgi:hypothetical protein